MRSPSGDETKVGGAAQEWRANWSLVLAAMLGMSFASIPNSVLGLFMQPLEDTFGWSRAMISSGLMVAAAIGLPLSPVAGVLVDKFGARRCAIPGVAFSALFFAAFSLMTGASWIWWLIWILHAFASLFIRSMVWNASISNVFNASRGLAIALVLSGVALPQVFGPPIGNFLIETLGWRSAFAIIGLGWGGLVVLVVFLFFRSQNDRTSRTKPSDSSAPARYTPGGLTFGEAMRDPAMLRIAFAVALTTITAASVGVHIFPLMEWAGAGRTAAASLSALLGVGAITGKIMTGTLADKLSSNLLPPTILMIPALGYVLIWQSGGAPLILGLGAFAAGFGSGGTLHMATYLTTRYAGMRNFGSISGAISAILGLMYGLGPIAAGWVFDKTSSYEPVLIVAIPAVVVAGLSVATLGPYRDFAQIREP